MRRGKMDEGVATEVSVLVDELMSWAADCLAEAQRRPQTASVRAFLSRHGHVRLAGELNPLSLIAGSPLRTA